MNLPMQSFEADVFSKQPGYDEPTVRKEGQRIDSQPLVKTTGYEKRCTNGSFWPKAAVRKFVGAWF